MLQWQHQRFSDVDAGMLFTESPNGAMSIEEKLAFFYQLHLVQDENQTLKVEVDELKDKVGSLEDEITRLKEQLELAKHKQFGKKSETLPPTEDEANLPDITIRSHTRKRKTKGCLVDLSRLPRRKVVHDLPLAQKNCGCCHNPLTPIGTDISEHLEVVPQKLYVEEHIRYKYACRTCDTITMAPKEPLPIPKALAGGSLLTEVIISKYLHHVPLYRMSKILESFNITIPDNTLANWVKGVGEGLSKIGDALWKAFLQTPYMQADETPVKILNPNKKGYLWTYYTPYKGKGLVLFEFSLTRGSAVVEERLKDYTGLLQTDGYPGYNSLRVRDDIEGLGCLSHARRKFDEAYKASKKKDANAKLALEKLKPLYELEAAMRESHYPQKVRKALRQKIAKPILLNFFKWLKTLKKTVLKKSALGEAIVYAFNQKQFIIKYLRHGHADIDTNRVEGLIRDIAIGRRNWLFMGNKDTGAIHALLYSLIMSARLNKLNPRLYLHYIIMQIHNIRTHKVDAYSLLPHTIDHALLTQFAQNELLKAKDIIDVS